MITTLSLEGIPVNGEAPYGADMALLGITSAQARMARAALRLGVRDVADLAGVSPATVVRVEREAAAPNPATLVALRAAFEEEGIEFVGDYGVYYRPEPKTE
jgi:transcriptional regulator with XRE-family HTH domain